MKDMFGASKAANEASVRHSLCFESEKETNFTWEHFFVTHCGLLKEDALEYERNLIAHHLSPEDTLLVESLSLLVEFGCIPVVDKIKIAKTLQRQRDALKVIEEDTIRARKVLGLEAYSDFEILLIVALGGGSAKLEIDLGIQKYETAKKELGMCMTGSIVSDSEKEAMQWATSEAVIGEKDIDPVVQLLLSFGYMTFDYMKGKSVGRIATQTDPASAKAILNDLLQSNVEHDED